MSGGIYLLLGANLGSKESQMEEAKKKIRSQAIILKSSGIYISQAWGKTDQPEFVNQVIEISTTLSPHELLESIQRWEKEMGRVRFEKWGPRIIDIDILFYNDAILEMEDLIVPHPQMANRRFTLVPLAEIAGDLIHPVFQKSVNELLISCSDTSGVMKQ